MAENLKVVVMCNIIIISIIFHIVIMTYIATCAVLRCYVSHSKAIYHFMNYNQINEYQFQPLSPPIGLGEYLRTGLSPDPIKPES